MNVKGGVVGGGYFSFNPFKIQYIIQYTQKNQYYKGKKDFNRKPWQNKDQKLWNKDNKKQYGNKGSKPKDACITITNNIKYFCPTGFDEGIFNVLTKLLNEKVEQAKRLGSDSTKTVNAIECDNFCNFFKIPEQLYDAAFTFLSVGGGVT